MTIKNAKAKSKSARDLKSVHILLENSAEDLDSIREHCRGEYIRKVRTSFPKKFTTMLLSGSRKGAIGA